MHTYLKDIVGFFIKYVLQFLTTKCLWQKLPIWWLVFIPMLSLAIKSKPNNWRLLFYQLLLTYLQLHKSKSWLHQRYTNNMCVGKVDFVNRYFKRFVPIVHNFECSKFLCKIRFFRTSTLKLSIPSNPSPWKYLPI